MSINDTMVKIPLSLYKTLIEKAMKQGESTLFSKLFSQVGGDPDFVLDNMGETVWMMWNRICTEESVSRDEKSSMIEYEFVTQHADDCDQLYMLYKRGGCELLKNLMTVSHTYRINACDKNGMTVLDKILFDKGITKDDVQSLRGAGYRFGVNIKNVYVDYLHKQVAEYSGPCYGVNLESLELRTFFLSSRIEDILEKGISANTKFYLSEVADFTVGPGDEEECSLAYGLWEDLDFYDDSLDLDDMEWMRDFYENYTPTAVLRTSSPLTLSDILKGEKIEMYRPPYGVREVTML